MPAPPQRSVHIAPLPPLRLVAGWLPLAFCVLTAVAVHPVPAAADDDYWRRPRSLPRPLAVEYVADLGFCVEQTNRYRESIDRPPLARSRALERYAAEAAPHDGKAHKVHRYFKRTRGGGIALAENQIPWWPLPRYGSVREVIRTGLEVMWSQGRGGGHYDNMAGDYSQLGCGVFVNRDQVTVVQAFR